MTTRFPPALISSIESGTCIAFVGSGFSVPGGVGTWQELLLSLASQIQDLAAREWIERRLSRPDLAAHDLDQVAQIIEDQLGSGPFKADLEARVRAAANQPRDAGLMAERVRLLRGIPFKAILTTNYDGSLQAAPEDGYSAVLRTAPRSWLQRLTSEKSAPVLKLHGDVFAPDDNKPVITRRDYRERLHATASHLRFLRGVLATHTVLYLGFSFRDAYLNELRSEVLSLLQDRGRLDHALGFAFLADIDQRVMKFYQAHEGVQVIPYDSDNGHAGFDTLLRQLHGATNPELKFATGLNGARILWIDPSPDNNNTERARLRKLCTANSSCVVIEGEVSHVTAVGRAKDFDLLITNWGWGGETWAGPGVPGQWLMRELHTREIDKPVIVFAGDDEQAADALNRGVLAYTTTPEDLFKALQTFSNARSHG